METKKHEKLYKLLKNRISLILPTKLFLVSLVNKSLKFKKILDISHNRQHVAEPGL